jgi:hypothetical protein
MDTNMSTPPRSTYAGLPVLEEIEARHQDFMEGFGGDGFFEEALITCLGKIEQICTVYFGAETARAGLDAMVGRYFPELVAEGGWTHALDREYSGIYSELPVGHLFHDLDAYANYGIFLGPVRDPAEREPRLQAMVVSAGSFIEAIPLEAWGIVHEHAVRIVRKAEVRFKLDTGKPVNAEELALISGMALQTIKNRLSGSQREIHGNQNRIEAHDALAWLASRKDFLPSLWKEQDDSNFLAAMDGMMAGCIFIPVAKDGSWFSPKVAQDGSYIVGAEGQERRISDFDEALAALQTMLVPTWRRPTEGGTWTRVRGVSWARVQHSDLPMG